MNRPRQSVDLAPYALGVPRLLTHPSILIAPIAGAAIALLFDYLGQTVTDPLGGIGSGIYSFLATAALLTAFGIAMIQASHIWRGRRGSFDDAWQEGRAKLGGILISAVAFVFALSVAAYVGVVFGPLVGILVQIVAAYFLIYTIAASSIGGIPGGAALSGSIRCARANPIGTALLALVSIVLWGFLPGYILNLVGAAITPFEADVLHVLIEAFIMAYLAFPTAKQYDDVAFRAFW
jgi:hypothetical protein